MELKDKFMILLNFGYTMGKFDLLGPQNDSMLYHEFLGKLTQYWTTKKKL